MTRDPFRCLPLLLAASMLAGCATYRNSSQVESGPGLEFKAAELEQFRRNQDDALAQLGELAGVGAKPSAAQWDAVIDAGMDYADSRCEAYMHALFRLDRDKKTVNTQIGLLGTAAAGLMAAAESAAKEVAAAAVLFGLAGSTVENLASSVLYSLDPSSVRTLVKSLQSTYRANRGSGYQSRPAAMRVIRGYAMLCVPANIEAEVNLAIKKATPAAVPGEPEAGQPPEVSNADTIVSTSFASKPDDNTALLRSFVFPGGNLDRARRQQLERFIRSKNLTVDVTSFMRLERFAAERAEAVKALNIK